MQKSDQLEGFFSEYGRIRTLTYKDQAYELIKQAILYQKFEMNNIYSQETICQALGISRTPVREALLELQKDGYVRFCRGKVCRSLRWIETRFTIFWRCVSIRK